MRSTPTILAAVLAATAFATPALAAGNGVAVRYSDLDLSTADGQAKLEQRINKAAREVCGVNEVTSGTRLPARSSVECYERTRQTVHDQVAEAIARDNDRG
jgi:UrcA family protein